MRVCHGTWCGWLRRDAARCPELRQETMEKNLPSAAPRRLDRGDVDFLHPYHRIESALCFIATIRNRVGQHTRRDLPGNSPLVFAPPALTFLPPVPDDCVPVAVRLFLIFGRNL